MTPEEQSQLRNIVTAEFSRHKWDTFVDEPPSIAQGGRGVVVPGCVDAYPEVKQVNVARRFKGLTYEFFNRYSDTVRNRLLGPSEPKETPLKAGTQVSALSLIEYQYPKLGIVVRTTIDKRDQPPAPFDLEVDFVTQQQEPRT